MPTQNTLIYYPAITDIVKADYLPEFLSFIKTGIENILSKIYYKDYYFSKNISGTEAFYSLSIISKTKIAIEFPGTEIYLVLNPDFQDGDISSFPITLFYHWELLRFVRYFNINQFSFSLEDFYHLALEMFNISEIGALELATYSLVVPSDGISNFQQLVLDINFLYGSNIVVDDFSDTKYQDLLIAVKSIDKEVLPTIFALYIVTSSSSIEEGKQKLNYFFSAFVPYDLETYVKDILIPKIRATLHLSAAIEFPRKILMPYIEENGVLVKDPNEDKKTKFLFAEADFYADTEEGIGYKMDVAGTLYPTFSEIANTGLLIQIQRLKLDLSKTKNIPEADALGYPIDFTGVYADAVSVTLPPKWFSGDSTYQSTLRIGGYNLLIGSGGGVTGTFALEAVPISSGDGPVTNFFSDNFSFKYPITGIAIVPDTSETIENIIIEYKDTNTTPNHVPQDLLSYINSLQDKNQYRFKFPLTIIKKNPVGEEVTFNNQNELRTYINSFAISDHDFMWLRLGKKDNNVTNNDKKSWRIGFKQFDISFYHGQVTSSHLQAALEIKKFKKVGEDADSRLTRIELLGEWESSENFKLSANFPSDQMKLTLFGSIILTLQSAELGRDGKEFFIGADTKLKFPNDNTAVGRIFKGKEIDLPAIRIYSNGRFEITGGIGFIPTNFTLPLGPVEMSVTGIHLGSIQKEFEGKIRNYNYIGFDGALNVDPIGLDIKGNGIKYYYTVDDDEYLNPAGKPTGDRYIHISTLSIDLVIPGSASEEQAIAIIKGSLTIPDPGVSGEYGGSVSVKIPDAKIAGEAYMRLNPKNKSFLVSAAVELGTPIPLGPIGIYGFKGLIGKKYVADKKAVPGLTENNTWYDYYVAPTPGVNEKKLRNPSETEGYTNPFSIGIGASLATIGDGGRTISLRSMMLLSIPNMFAIDAGLTILSDRLGLIESDKRVPPFYAFLIIGDDSLEFGVGANYQINKSSGYFIDVHAEMQAGFFFKNQKPWYINFGTREKPITALMFKGILNIQAQGFLMISAAGIEAGAKVGFNLNWGILKAYVLIEVGAHISFERPQVGGYLYIEGGAQLNIFRLIVVSLSISIFLSVELVKPFLIFAQLKLKFRIKLFIVKFTVNMTLTLKWEKDGSVDLTAISPLTYITSDHPDYAKQDRTNDSVKGVHMLTNESFALTLLQAGTNNNYPPVASVIESIIPLDTFIDIKVEKGLSPSIQVDAVIGSHTGAANNFIELIPPKEMARGGLTLRQVKHKYSIENIEIKVASGNTWVDYHPYEALFTSENLTDLSSLKIGHWQKNIDQYDSIRILATSPFSYMDPGEPGWVIPEQYGINSSSLFCSDNQIQWHTSNFLNIPYGTEYLPPVGYNAYLICGAYYNIEGIYEQIIDIDENGNTVEIISDAKMIVANSPNPLNYERSLVFSNSDNLIITLPEASVQIRLNLTTYSEGITIKTYKRVDVNSAKPEYDEIGSTYYSKIQLVNDILIGNPDVTIEGQQAQCFSKIKIVPKISEKGRIEEIHQEIANIWRQAEANAGESTVIILSQFQLNQIEVLNAELAILRSSSCSQLNCDSIVFSILANLYVDLVFVEPVYFINDLTNLLSALNNIGYPDQINVDFTTHSILILNLSIDISDYGFVTNGIKKIVDKGDHLCISEFEESRENYLAGGGSGETGKSNMGRYKFSIIKIQKTPEKPIEENYSNCDCDETVDHYTSICTTSVQEIRWRTLTEFEYEQTIPGQDAVEQDIKETIKALNKTIQPIWRPNTTFMLHFRLKDIVEFNGVSNTAQTFEYFYGFKTKGPVGHFHKQNPSYLDYIENKIIKTHKEEEKTITSLWSYIDFKRSYPNPDGNLMGSKPLFYGHQQCKIDLFFDKPYTSHMFTNWRAYKGLDEILMDMPIVIKDPVSDIIIPCPLPEDWEEEEQDVPGVKYQWENESDPKLPLSIQTYLNFLHNALEHQDNIVCKVKLGTPISPSVKMRTVSIANLKPEKLYTAIVYSAYDEDGNGEIKNQMSRENIIYEESQKIHEFAFTTSRYENFRKQVMSYQLNETDDDGTFIKRKQAVYKVELDLSSNQINNLYALVNKSSTFETIALQEKYIHPFDCAMEGILKMSPLDPPATTDFIKIVDSANSNVIALLIRNPEPFNDPRIPVQKIYSTVNVDGIFEDGILTVLGIKGAGAKYKILWNKDYSQAIIMHNTKKIIAKSIQLQFLYKIWDGNLRNYVIKDEENTNEEERLNTVLTEAITINK